jgi:hypothetical protein
VTEGDALFGVDELAVAVHTVGRAEAGLVHALAQAEAEGIVTGLDAGAVGAALIAARSLDRAERLPDKSAVYAIAQSLTPYRELLHALRLPAAIAPGGVPLPSTTETKAGGPDWLHDLAGRPD